MRSPNFLANLLPYVLVCKGVSLAIEARLWRTLVPPSMWHFAPKERRLVRASVVNGAVSLKMVACGSNLLGPMLLAAAILFWILAFQLAGSRR